ncbi:MAG: copper chaperone PCu(A)C [Leptospiraceae bacterium]|nr:copper chaperone PCu(A)C [Leptospiraceae bacterium]MCP5500024.1 copper chaperone PCu(A)C [Leptospiraceae bacterium]
MKKIIILLLFLSLINCKENKEIEKVEPEIQNPYVRLMPPGSANTGAFMEISNPSKQDLKLIGVSSDVANMVEIHNHISEDGMMKMRKVEFVPIPAGGKAVLKPGSFHVMLMGLKNDLQEKQVIQIGLEFSNGLKKTIQAEVKKIDMEHQHSHP